jgi:histidyl-tRNA synthetase
LRVDRIFTLLDVRRTKKSGADLSLVAEVYITAFSGKEFDGLLLERIRVARQLWAAGIRTEFAANVNPKPRKQFNASEECRWLSY